jgi:MFS family permease
MPLSMTGLGIVLLVSAQTGSFGRAGLIVAASTVTGAVTQPWWGRLIDRLGQARVLVTAGLVCNVSLSLLVTSVLLDLPLLVALAAAVGTGAGFTSAGSCVRSRWSYRLDGSPLLGTAFALETVVDECVYIIGPVLVTVLATVVHPAAGLAVCVLLGLAGALALAQLRDTEPPVGTTAESLAVTPLLPRSLLVPVVLASASLGAIFGGMELVVVAFATDAGAPAYAGISLTAWATTSLLAGVLTGTISWKASPVRRFQNGACLLAASMIPLPFADRPAVVTGLLLLSGFAVAPTLIALVALAQAAVPASRLNEALGWASMGTTTGVAIGAAGLGYVVDQLGPRAGFWGLVGIGGLLMVLAHCVPGPDGYRTGSRRLLDVPRLASAVAAARLFGP